MIKQLFVIRLQLKIWLDPFLRCWMPEFTLTTSLCTSGLAGLRLGYLGPAAAAVLRVGCVPWGASVLQLGAWHREGGGQADMLKSILFRLLGGAPGEDRQRVSAHD